jgi:membrane-associated phospholipid phosphatase
LNHWAKASLHTVFALYAAGLWGAWSIGAGIVAVPLAASVAWSRVRLGRHSCKEVLAGATVGLAAAFALLGFAGKLW